MAKGIDVTENIKTNKALILDVPRLQSFPQKITTKALTVFFWGIWLYLWVPLITALAWVFGVDLFYSRIFIDDGVRAFMAQLPFYLLAIDILVGSLILWAIANWLRFRGIDRRRPRPPVTQEDQAKYFKIDYEELHKWHTKRRVVLHHDEAGHPISADIAEQPKE